MSYSLDAGGSERQLTETAKFLNRKKWKVHVGCFQDRGLRVEELKAEGIPIVRFPVRSFFSGSMLRGMAVFRRYVRTHGIQLTHSFDVPLSIFGAAATLVSPGHVFLTSQRSYRSLKTGRQQLLLRFADKVADGIVVNCEAMRRHLVQDEGVPNSRIYLCYNGIDTGIFFPDPKPRPEFLTGAGTVIGTVSVLRKEKGLDTLVKAFANVRRQCSGVRLLIVGSGTMREELKQLAESLGVAADVHFQPAVTEVAGWLNAMDIFVLPSLSEALSNSLMEAMACGVAAVGSSVGGTPELIDEAVTGNLFPPGDVNALTSRILALVNDAPGRRRMGAAAAVRMRSMSIQQAGQRMMEIYSGLLSR